MRFLLTFAFVFALAAAPLAALDADDHAGSEILDKYLSSTQNRTGSLRSIQMDMDIYAQLPKLRKSGTFHALRSISKVGQIAYHGVKFIGDNTIKTDVIARYLTAEKQTQDLNQIAITPDNYKFKYKGVSDRNGQAVHVFQIQPKKKMVGLFKGELWVDRDTYLPVREMGKFVKNPSIFLKKVEFVRDYQIKDGVAVPSHIESTIDTRFWGPAQVSINYSNFGPNQEEQASSFPSPDSH